LAACRPLKPYRDYAVVVAGTVDIGEAQDLAFKAGGALPHPAVSLARDLAGSVDILGVKRRVLMHRYRFGFAVDLARGGEDEPLDAGGSSDLQDVVCTDNICRERVVGICDRPDDIRLRSEVVHDVDTCSCFHDHAVVPNVALD